MTEKGKRLEVIKTDKAKVCEGPVCPLCTPSGLILFSLGFILILNTTYPVQAIGWVLIASAYLKGFMKKN